MPALQQEGTFRGCITEYGLREQESGAKAITIVARIDEVWDGESEWEDWSHHGLEVGGDLWVIKKDATLNLRQVEALVRFAGWDGDLVAIVDGSWYPTPCQFDVTRDEYQGNVRFRVAWVAGYERIPGSVGNVTPERARELQEAYGPQFRAIAGNFARNAAPPAGKPKVPAPANKTPKPVAPPPAVKPIQDLSPAERAAEAPASKLPF